METVVPTWIAGADRDVQCLAPRLREVLDLIGHLLTW